MISLDFWLAHDTLALSQWCLRGVGAYIFLMIAAKLMGRRSIAQLRFADFIIAMMLTDIIAQPLGVAEVGMGGSLITSVVLLLLYLLTNWLTLKSKILQHFFDPPPLLLVQDGRILEDHLAQAKITYAYLYSEVRKKGIQEIQKISLAYWEADGTISVIESSLPDDKAT
ncbi:MAG: DUF421 domain-containing protein [Peptococcaceae bacterium]|nr:DUF421 domain-containing protein [Peptococcaceae bacterium]